MSWIDSARARLPDHLDAHGDLPPPWVEFPTYERYCIGWRMGGGEDWLGLWHVFLEGLGDDPAVRLAYLRRHAPAPMNWSESVHRVLNPGWSDEDDDEGDEDDADDDGSDPAEARRAQLLARGLIASDASYAIWRARQDRVHWPWFDVRSPTTAGRHWTRDLWFWSRHVAELRAAGRLDLPRVPWPWRGCTRPLREGRCTRIDRRRGLLTLVRMLGAGEVIPPWRLGLHVQDFADTFDDDMGYVDAYRLWGMSALDDGEMLRRFCHADEAPPPWRAWLADQFYLG